MEEIVYNETIKEKLIIAGMSELEIHGFADFSLRRVASTCNVSCAAPYKHFKDKDHFISEIISYVDNQWSFLSQQIMSVLDQDRKKQLIEICIAFVKFCIGNSHFRSIFMMNLSKSEKKFNMYESIAELTKSYFDNLTPEKRDAKVFKINSLVLGAVTMTSNDTTKNDTILTMLKKSIEDEL